MPTSSQALILLNVDNPNPLDQHIPLINQFQSSVRRNSDHTNQPLNSSPESSPYCLHRLSPSKSEYFGPTKCNPTCSADNMQPSKTSLYSSLEFLYQREPSTAIQKHDPTKASLRISNTSSLSGRNIFDPKPCCSRTDDKNLIYLMPKTAQLHYFTAGRYFSRLPRSFTENSFYEQRSYNQSQMNLTSDQNPVEVVKPVLEIRKSQQFHKPLQSLNALHNNMTLMSLNTDSYQQSSIDSLSSYEENANNLIQRLRSLGFRPYGTWSSDNRDEKQTIAKDFTANESIIPISCRDAAENDIISEKIYSLNGNKVGPRCLQVKIATGLSVSEEEIKKQLMWYDENGIEQEKVEKLVADIKSKLRSKKTKAPTIRMRKTLPESQPLTICFACDSDLQITHEDIKRELESQYPEVLLLSLRFDPVSVAVGNSHTKNRWVVCVSNNEDFQSLVKGGVTIAGSDRITVKPFDAVMLEEHNAYKLHQYVKEAKAMIARSKDERTKQAKKLKNKRIKFKIKVT
ncbi:Hypothetical predicted protein [Octopus vulgaris]|uniref:Uncharacterized protein n=1 Tax=Octopus vulgaris TaxID=6645 RepID=A0AA36ANJ2_OCTVU|nr:Hypothetical predicted protein [Octopus vulgaris]